MIDFHFPPIPPVDPSRQPEYKQHEKPQFNTDKIDILIYLLILQMLHKTINKIFTKHP